MSKKLNDLILRDGKLAEYLGYFRAAKVPDGCLTDDRRHAIVKSLSGERDEIWIEIARLCDSAATQKGEG